MLNGYHIIDADSHVYEPHSLWKDYLEPAYHDFAPTPDLKIKGESVMNKASPMLIDKGAEEVARSHPLAFAKEFSPESHVQAMYQMGVDIAFIYPTYFAWMSGVDTMASQQVGAYVRAYNNWLRDYCSYNPAILQGVGVVNLHDPEEMVSELRRIAAFGWRAVVVRPNPVKGRLLSDPAYEPFWTECEHLDIAVSIHETTHSRVPSAGADRFHSRFALHACSHPMEQMMALLALIEGGVLERYPQLRVGFLESGCGWLPYWLWRLDREYEDLQWEVGDRVKMKPSDYFRRQCFIAVEPSETYLPKLLEELGADNLIFGSDYPHMDHKLDVVADSVTSTWKQLEATKTFREMSQSDPTYSGELCKNFFLSSKGYLALGYDLANPRNEEAKWDDIDIPFKDGMKEIWERNYRLNLSDVPKGCTNVPKDDDCWYNAPEEWDLGGEDKDQIHALILLAHDDLEILKDEANNTIERVQKVGKVVACEAGHVLRDTNGQAVGPFGFVDGISQPLFLKADYDKYRQHHDTAQWDPKASLELVLIKDSFGKEYSYGVTVHSP